MTFYFANLNPYGSDVSVGFDNTNKPVAFRTKAERDQFIAANEGINLSVRKLTKAHALKIADRNGRDVVVETADGGYVRIR